MNNVPKDKMETFKATFQQYDRDSDNKISMRELSSVLKAFNLNNDFNADQTDLINDEISKKMKGVKVELEFFLDIVSQKYLEFNNTYSNEEVINAFSTFDKEGNGTISAEELRTVLTTLGDVLTAEEVDELIREADINSDGVIYYEDFVSQMVSK